MKNKQVVAYCGTYCRLCPRHKKIPDLAAELRAYMIYNAFEDTERGNADFRAFWGYLTKLVQTREKSACKSDTCGANVCGIKKCARRKNIDLCMDCPDYPCDKINMLAKSCSILLHDGKRIKEKGLSEWVREQEERVQKGFTYYDVACPCEEFPLDFS